MPAKTHIMHGRDHAFDGADPLQENWIIDFLNAGAVQTALFCGKTIAIPGGMYNVRFGDDRLHAASAFDQEIETWVGPDTDEDFAIGEGTLGPFGGYIPAKGPLKCGWDLWGEFVAFVSDDRMYYMGLTTNLDWTVEGGDTGNTDCVAAINGVTGWVGARGIVVHGDEYYGDPGGALPAEIRVLAYGNGNSHPGWRVTDGMMMLTWRPPGWLPTGVNSDHGEIGHDGSVLEWDQTDGAWKSVLELREAVANIRVAKNSTVVGTRPRINLVEGTNVTLTATDDAGTNEVDVTINATTAAPAPAADPSVWMPLTTVVGGVPELVWDANDNLIPTLTPI